MSSDRHQNNRHEKGGKRFQRTLAGDCEIISCSQSNHTGQHADDLCLRFLFSQLISLEQLNRLRFLNLAQSQQEIDQIDRRQKKNRMGQSPFRKN